MLERTTHIARTEAESGGPDDAAAYPRPRGLGRLTALLRRAWQFFLILSFSSLTRRIVSLNVVGLLALVIGILYLSEFRAGLIDARVQSLLVQGEIMAGAIAASATADTDSVQIDPERLLELRAGESYGPKDETLSVLEFPINPERVGPLLRRIVSPTKTRARIYDRDGVLILDSRNLDRRGDVSASTCPLPPRKNQASWSGPSMPSAPGSGAAIFRSTASSGPTTAWATRKSRWR